MYAEITLEPLTADNWLKVCDLSVTEEEKTLFPIPNVYWIGISRYEEKTELFAIRANGEIVGLIGGGYDEDGVTGYINPLMIDRHHQGRGCAKPALRRMIEILRERWGVRAIHINHRKANVPAGKIYASLGFRIYDETDEEYRRRLDL